MTIQTGMHEGTTTSAIDQATGRVPSLAYLGFAVASMAVSAALVLRGRKQLGNFIGQWAPSILVMGLYNKLLKVGSQRSLASAY